MSENILSQQEIDEKLKYWQKKLRLQDWLIQANIKRRNDMSMECLAEVNWTLEKKMATISIMDPIDYDPACMGERDMENDLVHELLHLHLAPISELFGKGDNVYTTFEEQAIESITSGLVSSER